MNIPIVFAIDNNVVVPCGVTITSLLLNAENDTVYEIYILHSENRLDQEARERLESAFSDNDRGRITFVDVGEAFQETSAFVTGHLTSAAYFRLMIPVLFPQYEKIIYSDVDIIFQQDLSGLFESTVNNGELLAAVLDLSIDDKHYFPSALPAKIGLSEKDYFNSGFLVMNLKQMREDGVFEAFKEHSTRQYDQNDQDVLNIVCKGRVQILPSLYNFQLNHFTNYLWGRKKTKISFDDCFKRGTLHYTWKNKPWNSLECVGADTWWHYYKMSPFYDDRTYLNRQIAQIETSRNDFRKKTSGQLFKRILVNFKHKLLGEKGC